MVNMVKMLRENINIFRTPDYYRSEVRNAASVRLLVTYTAQYYGTHLLKNTKFKGCDSQILKDIWTGQ